MVNTGGGYERVDADGSNANAGAGDPGNADASAGDPEPGGTADDDLGRAGWVLVAVVVVAFLVVPGAIYLRPTAPGELGFGFLASMLVLPFVPALLLGVTAVWSLVAGGNR